MVGWLVGQNVRLLKNILVVKRVPIGYVGDGDGGERVATGCMYGEENSY